VLDELPHWLGDERRRLISQEAAFSPVHSSDDSVPINFVICDGSFLKELAEL
jgi:hypothetical protein